MVDFQHSKPCFKSLTSTIKRRVFASFFSLVCIWKYFPYRLHSKYRLVSDLVASLGAKYMKLLWFLNNPRQVWSIVCLNKTYETTLLSVRTAYTILRSTDSTSRETVPLKASRKMNENLYVHSSCDYKNRSCRHNYNTISSLPPFGHPTPPPPHPPRGGITWLSLPLSYHINIHISEPKSWPQLVRSHPVYILDH